jgi:OmpA-OmpF porin, OOP family
MKLPFRFLAFCLASLPLAAPAEENYLGILKLPKASLETPKGLYSLSSSPLAGLPNATGSDNGYQLKLGYKYSRHFSVEGQFNDFARAPADMFAGPGSLASAFRGNGFGVDTIATLPIWRFSFYGRLGAYRGDARSPFSTYSTSLLGDGSRGTRWRYGLGMRYDFTKALGIQAELERYSPLGSPLSGELDSDLFSVGVKWRF